MKKATLYRTDGNIEEITPLDGSSFTLEELQTLVEGRVEIVPLPSGKLLVCNEDGREEELEPNENALKVWREEYPLEEYPDNNPDTLVGHIIVSDKELIY